MKIYCKIKRIVGVTILFGIILSSCGRTSEGSQKASEKIKLYVTASMETESLKNPKATDDAADDIAVWINSKDSTLCRIVGTDKTGGLAVYDMEGKELFFYPHGRMNNVDIRYNFPYENTHIDIVACTNRSSREIALYKIDKLDGHLTKLPTLGLFSPMKENVYGFCLGKDVENDRFYAFANSKIGEVVQWNIKDKKGMIVGEVVRTLKLNSKLEGMVADDMSNTLFIGEEEKGIWKTTITPTSQSVSLLIDSDLAKNEALVADIEGLAIYRGDKEGYLLASSQGNYSYGVFELKAPHPYLGSFRIKKRLVDAVEETDGIEAVSCSFGKFTKGIFIAQDGFNRDDNERLEAQNFKIVDWRLIDSLINKHMKK